MFESNTEFQIYFYFIVFNFHFLSHVILILFYFTNFLAGCKIDFRTLTIY